VDDSNDQYESNNWDEWAEDDVPLGSIVVDEDGRDWTSFWSKPRQWFDWSESREEDEIDEPEQCTINESECILQSIDSMEIGSGPVPLDHFISSSNTSMESFHIFLNRYHISPEDTGPTLVRLPKGICFPSFHRCIGRRNKVIERNRAGTDLH
jgi:hypothetical protein